MVRARVLRFLERRGVIEHDVELAQFALLDDGLAEREPALAQLAAAAVSGLAPSGPERRQRPAITLRGRAGIEICAPLSVAELGFSLHAATTAGADDSCGREALVCTAGIIDAVHRVIPCIRAMSAAQRTSPDSIMALNRRARSSCSQIRGLRRSAALARGPHGWCPSPSWRAQGSAASRALRPGTRHPLTGQQGPRASM
jgi:hypothetical protein